MGIERRSQQYFGARNFYVEILSYFDKNPKTTWGKNELHLKINELFHAYVDKLMTIEDKTIGEGVK